TDYALCIIGIGAENSADGAVVVWDRTIGKSVIGLFRIAVTLHDQKLGFDVGAFIASHRLRKHGLDFLPDLAPDGRDRFAERPRMLAADDRFVRVVVKVDQLAAPTDPDRLARRQHDSDGSAQALRPTFRGRKRGVGPIVRSNSPGEFAIAGNPTLRLGRVSKINFGSRRTLAHGHALPPKVPQTSLTGDCR